ncbi:hypothetical protein EDB89DRAFT_1908388 [Lactarius sanguifluus]|nr:hypothetical protein EDB89DRAFT_1909822 [Lactarius sanguifluus]KAH9169737.1 hypothetical protein EDB89DRAFT_1908388 [Lactarius sanguifluus]
MDRGVMVAVTAVAAVVVVGATALAGLVAVGSTCQCSLGLRWGGASSRGRGRSLLMQVVIDSAHAANKPAVPGPFITHTTTNNDDIINDFADLSQSSFQPTLPLPHHWHHKSDCVAWAAKARCEVPTPTQHGDSKVKTGKATLNNNDDGDDDGDDGDTGHTTYDAIHDGRPRSQTTDVTQRAMAATMTTIPTTNTTQRTTAATTTTQMVVGGMWRACYFNNYTRLQCKLYGAPVLRQRKEDGQTPLIWNPSCELLADSDVEKTSEHLPAWRWHQNASASDVDDEEENYAQELNNITDNSSVLQLPPPPPSLHPVQSRDVNELLTNEYTCEFDSFESSRDEYSRLRVLESTTREPQGLPSEWSSESALSSPLPIIVRWCRHRRRLVIVAPVVVVDASPSWSPWTLRPGSPLLLSSSVDVVHVAQLSQSTGVIAAAVLLLPASPRGRGQRASPRCNGWGVAPSLSSHRCHRGCRLAVAGGGIVASARGLKQPVGRSSYAKLAITGRGKHRSYWSNTTTTTKTKMTLVHNDNDPQRQWLTTTTAYQRPTTTMADDDNGPRRHRRQQWLVVTRNDDNGYSCRLEQAGIGSAQFLEHLSVPQHSSSFNVERSDNMQPSEPTPTELTHNPARASVLAARIARLSQS